MKKKLFGVFILLFLIAAILTILKDNTSTERSLLLRGHSYLEGVRIMHKQNGSDAWTLTARRADITEDESRVKLADIKMQIENKGLTIYADDGIYDIEKRNLYMDNNVMAATKDYTITANSAEWNSATEEIKTAGDVKVTSKKFHVDGKGMEATSEQKVRILKNVRATFYR